MADTTMLVETPNMKLNRRTFDNIPKEKQRHILEIATREFAQRGFENANINTIAEKAGISVGSLYKYFDSKKQLFLMTVQSGVEVLEETLASVMEGDLSIMGKIEKIIRAVQTTSREKSSLIQLYSEMTAVGNAELVKQLSFNIESISATIYTRMIREGQASGELRPDMDAAMAAFLFDNLLMSLQFSYANEYFRERFKVYVAEDILEHDDFVVNQMLGFVQSALISPQKI
ncbi:MAG: TetR/AcrR family transcriptional regulator [Sphaerochaetaceae bacterium]